MFSTHQLAAAADTEVWEEFISPAEASHGNSQSSPKLAPSRLSHCVHTQKGPLKGEAGSLGHGSLYSKTNCIHGEDKQKNIQQGLATTKKELYNCWVYSQLIMACQPSSSWRWSGGLDLRCPWLNQDVKMFKVIQVVCDVCCPAEVSLVLPFHKTCAALVGFTSLHTSSKWAELPGTGRVDSFTKAEWNDSLDLAFSVPGPWEEIFFSTLAMEGLAVLHLACSGSFNRCRH